MEPEVIYGEETCAHCEGAGCLYCDKKGKVLVRQPPRKCRHCGGDGCIYCGFAGWEGLRPKYPPPDEGRKNCGCTGRT